jgi:hypothetical protein
MRWLQAGKTSTSPERHGPLLKRRKRVIEDNDEEDEDEGPAASSGEFHFILHHVNLGLYDLALLILSDIRSTIAKLEPRSYVSSATW